MIKFNKKSYFKFLKPSVQGCKKLPFSVYVHLKQNKKALIYLKEGFIPSPEKLKKLKDSQIRDLFIEETDKKKYCTFLTTLFNTPEGEQLLLELSKDPKATELLELPEEVSGQAFSIIDKYKIDLSTKEKEEFEDIKGNLLTEEDFRNTANIILQEKVKDERTEGAEVAEVTKVTEVAEIAQTSKIAKISPTPTPTQTTTNKNLFPEEVKAFKTPMQVEENSKVKGGKHNFEEKSESFKVDSNKILSNCSNIRNLHEENNGPDLTRVSENSKSPLLACLKKVISDAQDFQKVIKSEIHHVNNFKNLNHSISNLAYQITRNEKEIAKRIQQLEDRYDTTTQNNQKLIEKINDDANEKVLRVEARASELYTKLEKQNINETYTIKEASIEATDNNATKLLKQHIQQLINEVNKHKNLNTELKDQAVEAKKSENIVKGQLKHLLAGKLANKSSDDNLVQTIKESNIDIEDTDNGQIKLLKTQIHGLLSKFNERENQITLLERNVKDAKKSEDLAKEKVKIILANNSKRDGINDITVIKGEKASMQNTDIATSHALNERDLRIKELINLSYNNGKYIENLEKDQKTSEDKINALNNKLNVLQSEKDNIEDKLSQKNMTKKMESKTSKESLENINELSQELEIKGKELKVLFSKFKDIKIDQKLTFEEAQRLPIPPEIMLLLKDKEDLLTFKNNELKKLNDKYKIQERDLNKHFTRLQEINKTRKRLSENYERLNQEKNDYKKKAEGLHGKINILTNLNNESRRQITRLTQQNQFLATEKANFLEKKSSENENIRTINSKVTILEKQLIAEKKKSNQIKKQYDYATTKLQATRSELVSLKQKNQAQNLALKKSS